jgi:hypothetical protein
VHEPQSLWSTRLCATPLFYTQTEPPKQFWPLPCSSPPEQGSGLSSFDVNVEVIMLRTAE